MQRAFRLVSQKVTLKVGRAVGAGPRAGSQEVQLFCQELTISVRLISLGISLGKSRKSPFGRGLIHLWVKLNCLGTAVPQETPLQERLPQTRCLEASGPRRQLASWEKIFYSFWYLAADLIKLGGHCRYTKLFRIGIGFRPKVVMMSQWCGFNMWSLPF